MKESEYFVEAADSFGDVLEYLTASAGRFLGIAAH